MNEYEILNISFILSKIEDLGDIVKPKHRTLLNEIIKEYRNDIVQFEKENLTVINASKKEYGLFRSNVQKIIKSRVDLYKYKMIKWDCFSDFIINSYHVESVFTILVILLFPTQLQGLFLFVQILCHL